MAEDCLYLSIWTPASSSDQLRAVMVLLTSGKEEGDLSGVEMAATGDVVFVRVESRHWRLESLFGLRLMARAARWQQCPHEGPSLTNEMGTLLSPLNGQ